jgi:hypothetical protein
VKPKRGRAAGATPFCPFLLIPNFGGLYWTKFEKGFQTRLSSVLFFCYPVHMEKGRGTIDLRKGRSRTPTIHPAPENAAPRPLPTLAHAILAPATFSLPAIPAPSPAPQAISTLPGFFEWTAFEHEQNDFGASWYVVPGGIMALLFALALFVQNYFFAAFVVIAFATLVIFRNQTPKKIPFSIGKEGVRAGKTLYQLSRIKSFWIFDRPGHPELSLETSQTLSPYIRLPLGDTDPQQIRQSLFGLLPEQQHPQFLMDEIMRIIGF